MASTIDFCFAIGSTYTYLAVMRINAVACRAGVTIRWRPFEVRSIMVEMNNIAFSITPLKAEYMWRDIERRTALYAIPWSAIPPYPLKHLSIPNRIALLGVRECQKYVNATYRRLFIGGHDASMDPAITETLAEIGQDAPPVIAWTNSDEGKQALERQTATARQLGMFGSPTFAVVSELFWGDERMDDAIKWCLQGTLDPGRKLEN